MLANLYPGEQPNLPIPSGLKESSSDLYQKRRLLAALQRRTTGRQIPAPSGCLGRIIPIIPIIPICVASPPLARAAFLSSSDFLIEHFLVEGDIGRCRRGVVKALGGLAHDT